MNDLCSVDRSKYAFIALLTFAFLSCTTGGAAIDVGYAEMVTLDEKHFAVWKYKYEMDSNNKWKYAEI